MCQNTSLTRDLSSMWDLDFESDAGVPCRWPIIFFSLRNFEGEAAENVEMAD